MEFGIVLTQTITSKVHGTIGDSSALSSQTEQNQLISFRAEHDNVNQAIRISVARHRNYLVRVERVVLMAISGVHATTLLEFFWVQVGHSLGPFQCCKDGTI
jgi:hypothetical protein